MRQWRRRRRRRRRRPGVTRRLGRASQVVFKVVSYSTLYIVLYIVYFGGRIASESAGHLPFLYQSRDVRSVRPMTFVHFFLFFFLCA